MSHQPELDKGIYFTILEVIQTTFGAIMLDEGKIPQVVVESVIEQWAMTVNENYQSLFDNTKAKISKYLNFYNVEPIGQIDEFKYIYFSGISISEKLEECGMAEHSKYHLKAVLFLLDDRLKTKNCYREHLSIRIDKAIQYQKIKEHFGEYGWYLTYKCLFNAALDK